MNRKYIDFITSLRLVFLRIQMPLIRFYIKKFSGAQIGVGSKFYGMPIFIIRQDGRLNIGNYFIGRSSVYSNTVGLPHPLIISVKGKNAKVEIGNNVGISAASINCRTSINIGNNVFIGGGVGVWDTDFHPMESADRLSNPASWGNSKPIVIEDDVFIGARSIVLKGVRIGKGSVIGAGTIVSKSVPENSIAYGNPMIIKQKRSDHNVP